jgi:hypothetical protein
MRIETELLRQIPELRAHDFGVRNDVRAVERDRAGCRLEQSREDAHERGFACAVRSEQTEHAGRKIELDALQGGHRPGIDLHEITYG